VIAEYENDTLVRKFIYGPGIDEPVCMIDVADDEPVCMIDVADSNTYYYHYDGLGSVIALSDESGNVIEKYKYSVYGKTTILSPSDEQRATSDVGNPYMFTGRRYDTETGLYYYRARCQHL